MLAIVADWLQTRVKRDTCEGDVYDHIEAMTLKPSNVPALKAQQVFKIIIGVESVAHWVTPSVATEEQTLPNVEAAWGHLSYTYRCFRLKNELSMYPYVSSFFAGIVHMFPRDFIIQFGYDVHITARSGPNYNADCVVLYKVQKLFPLTAFYN